MYIYDNIIEFIFVIFQSQSMLVQYYSITNFTDARILIFVFYIFSAGKEKQKQIITIFIICHMPTKGDQKVSICIRSLMLTSR